MRLDPPILCLISSRARLASRLGCEADGAAAFAALVAQAAAAAAAGVTLVQLREPDLSARRLADLATTLVSAIAPHGARLVVNDRLDVALASGAAGVHLKSTSAAAGEVRRWAGPRCLIGQSIHGAADRPPPGALDYLIFGTVFPTASKPVDWPLAGLDGLREAVRAARGRPVLAIGGITPANAAGLAAAGAAGLAAIDAFLPDGAAAPERSVQDKVRALRLAFDSPPPVPYHGRNG